MKELIINSGHAWMRQRLKSAIERLEEKVLTDRNCFGSSLSIIDAGGKLTSGLNRSHFLRRTRSPLLRNNHKVKKSTIYHYAILPWKQRCASLPKIESFWNDQFFQKLVLTFRKCIDIFLLFLHYKLHTNARLQQKLNKKRYLLSQSCTFIYV